LEWTLQEFYADGGTTTFIDRVAGSLGIHASTVKTVSVYEGSAIVEYVIESENDDGTFEVTNADGETVIMDQAALATLQNQAFVSGSMSLGAPILDAETSITSDETTFVDGVVREYEDDDNYSVQMAEEFGMVWTPDGEVWEELEAEAAARNEDEEESSDDGGNSGATVLISNGAVTDEAAESFITEEGENGNES